MPPTFAHREPVPDDDPRYQDERRCGYYGHRRIDKSLCLQWVIYGTHSCKTHAGKRFDLHRAEGQVAVEFKNAADFGLPAKYDLLIMEEKLEDPGEILLRLVTQSVWRVNRYAAEVERIVRESGTLAEALTGDTYAVTPDGAVVKTGEYIRAMTALESSERDRCATYASKAVAAGLAERQIRVMERQIELLEAALLAALTEAGLSREQQDATLAAVERHLRIAA